MLQQVRVPSSTRASTRSLAPRGLVAAPVLRQSRRSVSNAVIKCELKVGDKMEDYPDYYRVMRSSENKAVTLSSYKGKSPVVLFFYPKAGTPGCTKEACKFRDEYESFTKKGALVFGISSDTPEENAAFAKEQRLQYPLLSDQSSILRKVFGIKADLFGLLAGRQTFVIDKSGKCVLSFNDQFNAEQHVEVALKALGL